MKAIGRVVPALLLLCGVAWAAGIVKTSYYKLENQKGAVVDTLICLAAGQVDSVIWGFVADEVNLGVPSDSVAFHLLGSPTDKLGNGWFDLGSANNPYKGRERVRTQLDTLTSTSTGYRMVGNDLFRGMYLRALKTMRVRLYACRECSR